MGNAGAALYHDHVLEWQSTAPETDPFAGRLNRAHRILEHALEPTQLELWEIFPSLPNHLQSSPSCWRTKNCRQAQQQVPADVEDGAS